MGDAAVVAGRLHAVMGAQRLVAARSDPPARWRQVAERRRQAVAAVLARRAAERPQRVLQALRQGDETLAAEHHMGMLEAREGQAEMIEPMVERLRRRW